MFFQELARGIQAIHPGLLLAASIIAPLLIVPAYVYIHTTISYNISIASLNAASQKTKPLVPPTLPYSLPFLGRAFDFLSLTPGKFWRSIQHILDRYPSLSVLTVYMGGRKLHILYSPTAVTTFFKARNVSRNAFNRDVTVKGLCLNAKDAELVYGSGAHLGLDHEKANYFEHKQTELYKQHLLNPASVQVLVTKFIEFFQRDLQRYCDGLSTDSHDAAAVNNKGWHTIHLVDFVKRIMFDADTEAVFGQKLSSMIPDLAEKYWAFDSGLLARFFGLPHFLIGDSYRATSNFHKGMIKWIEAGNAHYNDDPPMDVDWEVWMGSSLTRARRKLYQGLGISTAGAASFEMGMMFGLNSNSIPATTWLLCHLLDPSNALLLAKIQEELETATLIKQSAGQHPQIDIPTLLGLPYLNSAFNETLRVYVDVLVTRELRSDMVIDGFSLAAGDVVMAPQYLNHHDPKEWNGQPNIYANEKTDRPTPPETEWFGERFLKLDPITGKATMSTRDTAGKFFPWGGGPHACPGRVFAKQEVLAAVAVFLLKFDIKFEAYIRTDRKGRVSEVGTGKGGGRGGFPVVKRQFSGNGIVTIEGDVKVTVRERVW